MTIYNVTIKPSGEENRFQVTWHDVETNTREYFIRESEITPEDTQRLWQWWRCQLGIGQKLFRFLDGEAHHFQQALTQAKQRGETLQLHLRTCKEVADWPFELLAKDDTFLLPQQLHLVRCVSDWGKEKKVSLEDRPLKLLFMACSAIDVEPELDFEREEEAIFHITEKLAVDMDVEDSGSLEGLRSKLVQDQYDVIHLSGHANIDKNGRPYFIMEDETGYACRVFPDELWNEALIENPPRLLFLSGCRTSEVPESSDEPGNIAEGSFARLLVEKYRVPAVLGWGRSVKDDQATHTGKILFQQLSGGKSILEAVQRARFELIKNFPTIEKNAWPLLRLFSTGIPLDPIVKKDQQRRLKLQRMKHVYLKNSQVQVLAEGFVGRRRQLQTSLKALNHNADKVGVVLLGTGGLGKSCLAGKICERFPDYTLIVVHGRFNTITLGAALEDAFIASQDEKGQKILSQEIEMADKLPNLCTTCFREKNYLLLLDDFEQNLEGAEKGQPGPLLPEAENLLKVLLHYLPHSGKMTQMIITSRYDFTLSEQNRNLVEERLGKVWLTGFRESEQLKKVRELRNIFNYEDQTLVPRLLKAGCGNPRLMEWLDILVDQMVTAEVPRLVEVVKDKQEEFIREHVIRELLQKGGEELACFLRWFSIFRRLVLIEGVKQMAEKADLAAWKKLLKIGMSLSLIEHDQARQGYQVTPLLREELLNALQKLKECHRAAFAYYQKVCEARESIDPILTEEWIFHALGCGEEDVASRLGGNLINHLRDRLAFQESRRVGEWILSKKKQECSTDDDALLLNEIAITINDLGEHPKAVGYCQQALAILRNVYGEMHSDVASTLVNMGVAWRALCEYKKAIDCHEEALSINRVLYGEEHPGITTILNNIGVAWSALNEPKKAINHHEQALSIDKAVYGKVHPNVDRDLANLGLAYYSLCEYPKAIDYLGQALSISREVYGEEHPKVAIRLNNLGEAWRTLGKHYRAIDYFEKALTIFKKVYGENHPNVAIALNNLGSSWDALSDHQKAIEHYERSLSISKKIYGEKHPNVATTLNNLGLVWNALDERKKAIDCYEHALSIDRAVYGDVHPSVATTLGNLGSLWNGLRDHKKSIEYSEHALSIWKEVYGENHPNVATALNNLGLAWEGLDEYKKAIDNYDQALSIDRGVYGNEHPSVAITFHNLGSAWSALGEHHQAIEYYEHALTIWKNVYGEKHPNVVSLLNKLGVAWDALKNHRQAIEYYEQALSIGRAVYGAVHPQVASTLNYLGWAWNFLSDYRQAIGYFKQSLSITRAVYGESHPDVARGLNDLGVVYFLLKQKEQAKDYIEKAYQIFNKFFGPEHPDTKNASEWLKVFQ